MRKKNKEKNRAKVKAFIFCGGRGKRLMPLTEKVPKPLLKIKRNFTILDKQLLEFKKAGIKEVYLLVGYLNEKIKKKYGKKWNNLSLYYSKDDPPRGTLFALRKILKTANCDLVGINGDIVTDLNIKDFLNYSQASPNLITIAITKLVSPYGVLKLKGKKILEFQEKPVLDYYINGAVYYIRKEAFYYFFKKYKYKDIERTVFPKLAKLGLIGWYHKKVLWTSIDSIKDLERIREKFRQRKLII